MSNYATYKQKMGFAARTCLFSLVPEIPSGIQSQLDKSIAEIINDMKFMVKGTQIPERTLGDITTNYEGMEAKQAGDPVYTDITCTYMNDVPMTVRNLIDVWQEYIVDPVTNDRKPPSAYQTKWKIYQVSNAKANDDGDKTIIRGWQLYNAYPNTLAALEKNWDTKDEVQEGTFTIRYDYFTRLDSSGNEVRF